MAQEDSGYRTYHMEGGDGPCSYSQNSNYQKQSVDSAKQMTNEMIDQYLDLGNHLNTSSPNINSFTIADFGCSVGPNTFYAVHNIIEAVENKFKSQKMESQIPEFHVFFNDHIDNDFNTLLKNLPTNNRGYFAAAVPGSFHGRLVPDCALNLAHCSTALHWLSKIPKEVTDEKSPAWNRGRIHYAGADKEVKEAFSAQFGKDLDSFLTSRGRELVPGGLLIIVTLGFPDGVEVSESSMGENFNILGSCFRDMVEEGIIADETLDSFNLPFYYPSPSEMKAVMEANGLFDIKIIEELVPPITREKPDLAVSVLHLRAIIGGLIKEHFGEGIIDDLFERHIKKYVENPIVSDEKHFKEASYFVLLQRKMDVAS
ncbi:hypothetical protein ACH5RR_013869 [Cinchona calisaya]|uniref:S-adenosylmethionine-dependent methyltransferase n=1 Tax=Cinchona calisaya TaxID=153742 RepID=A0ABD3A4Y4_9GENT